MKKEFFIFLAVLFPIWSSCGDSDVHFTMTTDAVVVFGENDPYQEIRDYQGDIPDDNTDIIYAKNIVEEPLDALYEVVFPDRRPVTLADWLQAEGNATATCEDSGTRIEMRFSGLIPGGTYTGWIFLLARQKTSTDPIENAEIRGMGALGEPSGSQNVFVASQEGKGGISLTLSEGRLSIFGELPLCLLTDVPGVLVVLDYHIDGMTHGSEPGPDKDDVSHMHVYF